MRKKFFALILCALLACFLTGCSNSVGNAVSDAGKDVSGAASRLESDMGGSSSHSSASSNSSSFSNSSSSSNDMMDSSGTVDSGTDGFIDDSSASELESSASSDLRDDDRSSSMS